MSLTAHLRDPASPVRAYLASTFPHLRALRSPAGWEGAADAGERRVRLGRPPGQGSFPPPLVLPRSEFGYAWATAGTAFDYRVRYLFETPDPHAFVAAAGARLLAAVYRAPCRLRLWAQLGEELVALTGPPHPAPPSLAGADERRLVRLCVLLAWFEQLYRFGPVSRAWRAHPLVTAGEGAELEQALGWVPPMLVDDVAAMTTLLRRHQRGLLAARPVAANPTFARSRDLGGADADLIVDHLLLEIKTSKRVSLARDVVWQLVGYLLADTDDQYRIDAIGWYFARHGLLWTYDTSDFLARLAGAPVDVAAARAEFAAALAKHRAESLRRRRTPGTGGSPDHGLAGHGVAEAP